MTLWVKVVAVFGAVSLVGALGVGIYKSGESAGKAKADAVYAELKNQEKDEIIALKSRNQTLEGQARERDETANRNLRKADDDYKTALVNVARNYDERLRKQQTRADVYQRQAQAGEAQSRDLASHAARLDASLEEGRRVVAELTATLRLRDSQLIQAGKKINSDYELMKD